MSEQKNQSGQKSADSTPKVQVQNLKVEPPAAPQNRHITADLKKDTGRGGKSQLNG